MQHKVKSKFHKEIIYLQSNFFFFSWLSQLESTRWLHNLSALIGVASFVVANVDKNSRPVLIHCSDGWDRTPQITALAEIMLDSYYRTIEGFQILVQREWIAFGHKFGDRCGHGVGAHDSNERSPVFLQWLDCIYQLFIQNPVAFEFNEMFLVRKYFLSQEKKQNFFFVYFSLN
jgi:myotubularin-related protein 3/4